MSKKVPHFYTADAIREKIEAMGLVYDAEAHDRAVVLFRELKITQKQHDALVMHHAKEVYALFDPKGKGLRFRLLMAAHFLGLSELRLKLVRFFLRVVSKIKGA